MPHILVVDDDALLRELVRHKLQARGYDVTTVDDSTDAYGAALSQKPDLIVLDSMMPIMSGSEVLLQLKAQEPTRSIPVIMLTARKAQDDVVRALSSGASDYLTKPFMPDELALRITGLLGRASGRLDNARVA